MHTFIISLSLIFCLHVFNSTAAPAPFSFTRTSSLPCLQANNVSTACVSPLPFNLASANRYPRELNDVSELQPVPNAFFPKYGIVLLILFIIICALSSALVIVTLYSGAARARIRKTPGCLCAALKECGPRNVQKDNQSSHRGRSTEKKRFNSPLNMSYRNCNPSSPYDISSELTNNTKTNYSEETMSSIPAVSSIEPIHIPSPSSHKRSPSRSAAHSPQDLTHSRPLSPPLSPFHHLQELLSTSKRVLQSLTADRTSQSSTPRPPSPNITSSAPATKTNSDGSNVTEVECDLGCQDIASIPAAVVSVTISTPQSFLPRSTTHSSPSINCRSGFYSLLGETQLSAKAAFHSFIDLSMLGTPSDTKSDAISASNPTDGLDAAISLLPPRYMHGLQLETIHEEGDDQMTSLAPALSAAVVLNAHPKILSIPDTKKSHTSFSHSFRNLPTSLHGIDPENSGKSDSNSTTENVPSSRVGLSHEIYATPRFFSAARPPPPPSEPSSIPTAQVVSALRSPERQDKRRSVAWLQPVIDWAVDHPQEGCECDVEAGSLNDLVDIPDMEKDAECAAALHSADAMAAVMDSLAAIGLDPIDMGLVTGEEISSSLSDSSFHATSPSLPFVYPETFRPKLYARAETADSDLIEEEEVENEIGVLSGYITPHKSHQLDDSSHSEYESDSENQYNRSLYQDQQHGESIKTALVSLLSPSSLHLNPGCPPEAHGKLSNNSLTPARASEAEGKTPRRDPGRGKYQSRNLCMQNLNTDSKKGTDRALSPTTSRTITRASRAVQVDRVYASPSSLAGLSPLEVAKKFSAPSISSAGSTPSPSGKYPASPPRRPTSVSPLHLRKVKGSTSPSFDYTASALASSPCREPISPSPQSRTPISSHQRWQQGEHSALRSTKSNPMLSLSHDAGFLPHFSSSPISPMQQQKPPTVSALARSAPILIERTNSTDFDSL